MKIMIPEGISAETEEQNHQLSLIENYENGYLITDDHNQGI